ATASPRRGSSRSAVTIPATPLSIIPVGSCSPRLAARSMSSVRCSSRKPPCRTPASGGGAGPDALVGSPGAARDPTASCPAGTPRRGRAPARPCAAGGVGRPAGGVPLVPHEVMTLRAVGDEPAGLAQADHPAEDTVGGGGVEVGGEVIGGDRGGHEVDHRKRA